MVTTARIDADEERTDTLKIMVAQLNPTVGALNGNRALIAAAHAQAVDAGADLVVCPELAVCGYPPEDLVLKPFFIDQVEAAVAELAALTVGDNPALLVGAPWRAGGALSKEGAEGALNTGAADGALHNAALLLDDGAIAAVRFKHLLPNYGVFDEQRVFAPGPLPGPVNFRGVRLGVMICEDMWQPDVTECLQESGAEVLIVLNGSPFEADKIAQRREQAVARVQESGLPLLYVNQVGGQDELVFDGASFVVQTDGALAMPLPVWRDATAPVVWQVATRQWAAAAGHVPDKTTDRLANIYQAMTLGLRDYVNKNGFPGVVLGLSGGIDSALSAAVAVDALGPDRVWTVMMPSPYTSQDSLDDAAACADLLGVRLDQIGIEPAMVAFDGMLAPLMADQAADTTEENIQARARGITLMALSNKFGHMVLSTGNKSEMSVGYATLYGDMCGGFSVLKDVYKMDVFALSHWRNGTRPDGALGPEGRVIPERIITKPPSAELKPDQKDADSLPPYDALDDMLHCLIEEEMSVDQIVARGHARDTVARIWKLLDIAEYKRRQAPPGVKLTSRAFGKDRRYPITNAFKRLI